MEMRHESTPEAAQELPEALVGKCLVRPKSCQRQLLQWQQLWEGRARSEVSVSSHMQYIKTESGRKRKKWKRKAVVATLEQRHWASETIKTIITSDKFIARTNTHTHTQSLTYSQNGATKTLAGQTDRQPDESLSFCGLKPNVPTAAATKVPQKGDIVLRGRGRHCPHYWHAGHTTFAALKASSTNANSWPHKYQ